MDGRWVDARDEKPALLHVEGMTPRRVTHQPRRVLYAHTPAIGKERSIFAWESNIIQSTIECGQRKGVSLEVAEVTSHNDLQRALLEWAPHVVAMAGHGPDYGLYDEDRERYRPSCLAILAEQLASACAPSATMLLLGCNTTQLANALAERKLEGVSFDSVISPYAIHGFLAGWFIAFCAGISPYVSFEQACISMAAHGYLDAMRTVRWFGPNVDVHRGARYQWIVPPPVDLDIDG